MSDAIAIEARRVSTGQDAFERTLARSRKTGLAFVDCSENPGVATMASPALQWNGETAAVVSLLGHDRELAKLNHPAARKLREFCLSLSREFGSPDPKAAWKEHSQ